jgi:hypothetical protein
VVDGELAVFSHVDQEKAIAAHQALPQPSALHLQRPGGGKADCCRPCRTD